MTDPIANIAATLHASKETSIDIRVVDAGEANSFVDKHCPSLLRAPNYEEVPDKMDAWHSIDTVGPPIFSKPRPLDPKKLEVAKGEFDNLMKLGIVSAV